MYQALREINNKTDGVTDNLLPRTRLRFAYLDSKCDSSHALVGALHLARDAFAGAGVIALVGAGCSKATESAAQVAAASRVPIISPVATSPTLSDGRSFPYFLRTVASDAFTAIAMVDVLRTIWP